MGANENIQIMTQALLAAAQSIHRTNALRAEMAAQQRSFELRQQEIEQNAQYKMEYLADQKQWLDAKKKSLDIQESEAKRRRVALEYQMFKGKDGMIDRRLAREERQILTDLAANDKFRMIGAPESIAKGQDRLFRIRQAMEAQERTPGNTLSDLFIANVLKDMEVDTSTAEQAKRDPSVFRSLLSTYEDYYQTASKRYSSARSRIEQEVEDDLLDVLSDPLSDYTGGSSMPSPGGSESSGSPAAQAPVPQSTTESIKKDLSSAPETQASDQDDPLHSVVLPAIQDWESDKAREVITFIRQAEPARRPQLLVDLYEQAKILVKEGSITEDEANMFFDMLQETAQITGPSPIGMEGP